MIIIKINKKFDGRGCNRNQTKTTSYCAMSEHGLYHDIIHNTYQLEHEHNIVHNRNLCICH